MHDTITLRSVAVSRRSFVIGAGALGIGVTFGGLPRRAFADGAGFTPNAWVSIGSDGTTTLMSPGSEMGQGTMTALPSLLAEDLDADWTKVRVVQSPDDAKRYGNPKFFGILITVGSAGVFGYYELLRLAGAQARKVLLVNAAKAWNVPVDELSTEPGTVVHAKSGRRIGYGELAKSATVPDPLPEVGKDALKPLAQCRYIGKDIARVDIPLKVNGTAQYGIDTQLPNMVYAAVLHPPVQGEKPEQIDDAAAKAVKGILAVVPLPHGVGVIGTTVEGTMKAKDALKVTWSTTAKARTYSTAALLQEYGKIAADRSQPGVAMVNEGDTDAALAGAAKVVAADFFSDHVAHVTMEPMNATAVVDGDRVELWASNQSPTDMQHIASHAAGTGPEKVKVHTPFLGGGFGRRTDGDEVDEVVRLAKTMPGRPIKLVWSREDDIQNDKWRPLSAQRVEVGLDAAGNIVGWRHRVVAESYIARAIPQLFEKGGGKDVVSAGGGEFRYKVPAHRVEYVRAPRGVDVGAWRGVGPGYTKFAIETLIDEIAGLKKIDPVAFRLDLLKHDPRAVKVIQTVADMAQWSRKRDAGRALGIGYSDALNSYTAHIAEVSLNQQSGDIRVHKVWCAIDCGVALQPHNIAAQVEGAAIMAFSAALYEQVNIKNGEVQESNLDLYRVPRITDVPEVEVHVITTDNPPTGVGEAGISPTAPAIANAVAQLTGGKRLRYLPMNKERVRALMMT